jgi:hypothetical protein
MANINNTQPIPMDNVVSTKPSSTVIHQLSPAYDQRDIELGEINYQNPGESVGIQQNGQTNSSRRVANGRHVLTKAQGRSSKMDYLNIIWSAFNTCCCIWPAGLIALIVSICIWRKRLHGGNECPRIAGIVTAVFNVFTTIGGIFLFIFYLLPLIQSYRTP